MLGAGVDVEGFKRVRDAFADLQYRAQNMAFNQHQTTSELLGSAELSLSEPTDNGIGQVLAKFWSAWDDLANHPESPATRQALVNQASLLTDRLNTLQGDLTAVRTEAQTQYGLLTGPTGDVLAAAQQIAQLNASIRSAVQQGASPNDLLDRRDVALDKLSGLAQVSVTDLGDGSIRVNFGDAATPLVDDTTVTWPQTLTSPGGRLGALLQVADTSASGTITGYLSDLDAVASQLISSVNSLHGTPFFSGTSAATIGVAVTASTVQAAPAGSPAGANQIALAVEFGWQLQDGHRSFGRTQAHLSHVTRGRNCCSLRSILRVGLRINLADNIQFVPATSYNNIFSLAGRNICCGQQRLRSHVAGQRAGGDGPRCDPIS